MAVTTQNHIHEEIKSRLISVTTCYHSGGNLCLPVSYQKTQSLKYKINLYFYPLFFISLKLGTSF